MIGLSKKEHSEDFARNALTWMVEQKVAPTPENFQLWFAYATRENLELARHMDGLIAAGDAFDEVVLEDLRQRYLDEKTDQAMAEVGQKITAELETILRALEVAGKDSSAYGRTLHEASGELDAPRLRADDLKALIDSVIDATRAMEARSHVLEKRLYKSSREVNELRERLESARRENLTDQLTGIANRKAFEVQLHYHVERAKEAGHSLCLVMCDIDHFKTFNDNWGHPTGDQVLRLVANCLSENVKGRDTAARYGGEEFAIILPQTALDHAERLANQIRHKIESKDLAKKSAGYILGHITLSAGVSLYRQDESLLSFVQRADACLYAAKRAGRNCVVAETHPDYMASEAVA